MVLGAGDDAAVIAAPDRRVVATADMLIEGRHFRRDWSSALDVGHKAAARNLADVAAMGAAPTALLVCFAGPPTLEVDWVLDLAAGIAAECASVGAQVAGGDTSSAGSVLLATPRSETWPPRPRHQERRSPRRRGGDRGHARCRRRRA